MFDFLFNVTQPIRVLKFVGIEVRDRGPIVLNILVIFTGSSSERGVWTIVMVYLSLSCYLRQFIIFNMCS